MSILKYIVGWLRNIFNPAVSLLAQIDNKSLVNKNAKIWRFAKLFHSNVGAYSYVGSNTEIVFANIGKFCSIAGNSTIGMGSHTLSNISTSSIFTAKKNGTGHAWSNSTSFIEYKRIFIGNDVWIGTKVLLMSGITIGDGAVIGAGSIVTKDIPPYAIAVGVPARVIKYRFDQQIIEKLLTIRWWNLSDEKLKEKITFFQKEKISIQDIELLESN